MHRTEYGTEIDMKFNPSKSCLFRIGKDVKEYIPNLQIDSHDVGWVDKLNYLVMYFNSGRTIRIETSLSLRKFFALLMLFPATSSLSVR